MRGPIDGQTTDAGGAEPEGVTYKWIGDKRRVFSDCAEDIVITMAATAFLIAAALLGHAKASVVELNCSENATCLENMAKEFVRGVRQQKSMRLFDTLSIEPLNTRQARSNEGLLARLFSNNAFSFDWNDYTFRIWKAQDRKDALDFEVFEGRTAKDVSEDVPKKSKSKVENEEEEDDKKPKKTAKGQIIRRRAKKRIMQAVIPMVFGMKSSAALIFAMFLVTVLTLKAFVFSKMALIVTVAMALKRLYESYSMGGLQNNPYLYSQYPIDFPSASSHAYSVSGMSPQFPEMFNPTGMASQQADVLNHNDVSAQQSQQAPTVQLLNSTRASERWDGKSMLEKLLEPIVSGIRNYVDPIANVFYSMPATFRGLNEDVTTTKTVEEEKKPREILVPQPRFIAQRKMNYRKAYRTRPKKYTELKIDLEKLKSNKDLYDYLKTKKYKFNYQNTYYYPRIKYFINPNSFYVKPTNTRLVPYRKDVNPNTSMAQTNGTSINLGQWRPAILVPVLITNKTQNANTLNDTISEVTNNFKNGENSRHKRAKRSIDSDSAEKLPGANGLKDYDLSISGRSVIAFMQSLSRQNPLKGVWKHANIYTKKLIKSSIKSVVGPPLYYSMAYDAIMMTLDVIDGLVQVHQDLIDYFVGKPKKYKKRIQKKKKKTQKKKNKMKTSHHQQLQQYSQQQQQESASEEDTFDLLSKNDKPA